MFWREHPAYVAVPGAAAVVVMALVVALAHGVPGVDKGRSPAQSFSDQALREQLKADTQLTLMTDVDTTELDAELLVPNAGGRTRSSSGRTADSTPRPFVRDYRAVAYRAAKQAGIKHPILFVRQMAAESGYQPCARSGAGAVGIAQIMPATARSWHVDPYMPDQALTVAAQHMARYEKQLGSYTLALAAYNAGPGSVRTYGGVPPYPETREYIRRVTDRSYPLRGMSQVYHLPAGMNLRFERRLERLRRAVSARGGRLVVVEGWRSYDEQVRLWKLAKKKHGRANARAWAAPPGCSNHGRGYAADLAGDLGMAHDLAGQYGLVFPMGHEPWHVELAGIPTQSG